MNLESGRFGTSRNYGVACATCGTGEREIAIYRGNARVTLSLLPRNYHRSCVLCIVTRINESATFRRRSRSMNERPRNRPEIVIKRNFSSRQRTTSRCPLRWITTALDSRRVLTTRNLPFRDNWIIYERHSAVNAPRFATCIDRTTDAIHSLLTRIGDEFNFFTRQVM